MHKKNKKCSNKVEKFCYQMRQGFYFIYTVCYQCLHKHIVKLFEHEKYILTTELYCPVISFDEETYICHTYQKHLSRNEMPCQAVFKKNEFRFYPR